MHNLKPTIGKEEIMHNLKPTIGIEVHTILNTKSKMFSPSSNIRNSVPNSTINEIDLALPGTMPSPNKEAVIKAIKLALALEMEIDTNLLFDRKHYFYQDLPKGFQITQQYFPIGKNGKIKISNKVINIERIHIEEDTAKQLIIENQLCLDYNRCGAPLVEIVTKPEFESEIEVVEYLNELKRILIFLNISDGKMEDGSLRCDVNISVSQKDSKTLGSKVEIKNINSFKNVADAIKYEIKRQSNLISTNKLVEQETRRWDGSTNSTIFMRKKVDSVDYHYFTEPNIVNIDIKYLLPEAKKSMTDLPNRIKEQLTQSNVNINIINQLLDDFDSYLIFKHVNELVNDVKLTTTWILIELSALLSRDNLKFSSLSNDKYDKFIKLIKLLQSGKINGKQAKVIFEQIYSSNIEPETLIEKLGFKQIMDEQVISNYFSKYIDANSNMLNEYKTRPERVEKYFIGMLMKDTKGQANPNISMQILKKMLKKYE